MINQKKHKTVTFRFFFVQAEDTNTKTASIDILLFIVEFSPSMVREYMLQQLNSTEDVSSIFVLFTYSINVKSFIAVQL